VTVHVSLSIEDDTLTADEIRLRILATLGDRFTIQHASAVDLDTVDVVGEVLFVVCPARGLLKTFVDDEDHALELAKEQGAVVVRTYADDDFRGEVTA
jgi:hypothetical protein